MKYSIPSRRQLKIGELVRHAIAGFLQRKSIHGSIIEKLIISVSEVRMSSDLKIATCFVMPLGGIKSEELVVVLTHNEKYVRGQISKDLRQIKYVPELRFRIDTSFDYFEKINSMFLLKPVMKDIKMKT